MIFYMYHLDDSMILCQLLYYVESFFAQQVHLILFVIIFQILLIIEI